MGVEHVHIHQPDVCWSSYSEGRDWGVLHAAFILQDLGVIKQGQSSSIKGIHDDRSEDVQSALLGNRALQLRTPDQTNTTRIPTNHDKRFKIMFRNYLQWLLQ